jgi:hypothetical protein
MAFKIPGELVPRGSFFEYRQKTSDAVKNTPKRQRFLVAGGGYRYNIE